MRFLIRTAASTDCRDRGKERRQAGGPESRCAGGPSSAGARGGPSFSGPSRHGDTDGVHNPTAFGSCGQTGTRSKVPRTPGSVLPHPVYPETTWLHRRPEPQGLLCLYLVSSPQNRARRKHPPPGWPRAGSPVPAGHLKTKPKSASR